ncbi:MAG: Aspartyl-tRNA synthetase [Candidatus Nomurabacteria bacterium GW2011_GWA2_43_15]|uniref:Aspartate--tRNA ligase n=2 Tax=Candidatus Nomuraibacteriota TaxID=1752729 RepID=A0A0G1DQZ3_9BACT|nr:MAG: Aspartyl-tRNA synthetase [Candidatus Nomurabacteria bacterium GW2011_GWA2_43_15]KKT19073.1 MAG: Aspartyl-tRNA synthetase [Candidatus Nomurabacteria bacterium GW2011_GWB1_43_7]
MLEYFSMKNRIYIKDLKDHVGKEVIIAGWVDVRRDQGKMVFFDMRDMTGKVQCVALQSLGEGMDSAKEMRPEWVLKVYGIVKKRPDKNINKEVLNGDIEIEVLNIEFLSQAATLPFDMSLEGYNLDLTTELDNRSLVLRQAKIQAIFKVQETVIDSFREFMKKNMFFEFQAPVITPATAEGGAEVFQVNYFDKKAYLTQSPQLYKQIVMSAFERCFTVNKVFRAEPSSTTRHLTEVVCLDAEMGFIDSWTDVRDMAEETFRYILRQVETKNAEHLKLLNVTLPVMIEKTPTYSLREVQQKIFEVYKRDVRGEKDTNPQDEREICEIVKKETGSDFVFIYGYPTRKKPFYVYPNPDEPDYNEGMDLICRGVEWLSGGRRINSYDQLNEHVKLWNMDPNKVKMFLEAFKYGVPPEGGFSFGSERITMQLLQLKNIREATMFPRDMNRIDEKLNSEGY